MKPNDLPTSAHSGRPASVTAQARALLDSSLNCLAVVAHGHIVYANAALARLLGWPVDALLGRAPATLMVAEHQPVLLSLMQGPPPAPGVPAPELVVLRRDGTRLDVRLLLRVVDYDGQPAHMLTLLDLSELKAALRRAEWNAGMLARTETLCRAGSFELDVTTDRITVSAGLMALLGRDGAPAQAATLDELDWVPADERAYVSGIWRHAEPGEPFEFQHRVQHRDGHKLVVLHRGQIDDAGHGVALLQDITERVEAERRIQELATQHEVTGLPNRAWLLDQVDAALHAARWDQRGVALLAIDLPRIAEVKANMGFGAGDTLCMALASRLSEACRAGEAVAQLGDAEFAVMLDLSAAADDGAQAELLRQRAAQLHQALQLPVRLGATDVYVLAQIGIAFFPAHGDSPDRLLEAAQTARLDVPGGNGLAFFNPEATTRAQREMAIESALAQALARNEFELHYQPQVDLGDGRVNGAEALLRWNSAELGRVSPGEFIPVAERCGLIGAIGDWVLRRACEQIAAWKRAGLPALRVGVNLSSAQLQRPDLAAHVQAVLLETGADPASLGLELTESMLAADVEGAARVLSEIRSIGVQISLDDFGTGFSSLSYLARLPIDVVKVDRSFVHDVTAEVNDVSITRAIISLTHSLKMRALAEGVETEGQLSLLAAAGCDEVQGYWFSPPVPADRFAALLGSAKGLPERFIRRGRTRTRTLLLVDDEDNILAALKRLLRRDGYRILTATSAAEGLQRLAEEPVDVIISDQRMPGMTGVEFLHRAKDLYPHTVRMVLSGYTELQSIIDAVNEGATYKFLTKPWDDERLRGHVAEAFRQKELADENRRLAAEVAAANADLAALNDRLERLLQQQREQSELMADSAGSLRGVLDELPAPVLVVDPDGQLVFVNAEAERLLPGAALALGEPANDHLPAAIVGLMAGGAEPAPLQLELGGRRWRALARPVPRPGGAKGCLLLLQPDGAG